MKSCVIVALFYVGIFQAAMSSAAGDYTPLKTECDGFAQLPVVTSDGLCVGLVARRDKNHLFKMPRTLIQTADNQLLIADMGAWKAGKGTLWQVDYRNPEAPARVLLDKLNLPHKILWGPKGKIYLGEADRISRFEWRDGKLQNQQVVLGQLPVNEEYLHPLKNFTFDTQGNLLVSIGSSSDRCDKKVALTDCVAGVEAAIRRYRYDAEKDSYSTEYELLARGLRNSMALVVHRSGRILQAENSIDFPETGEPYEELNLIEPGKFYGWPLCYNHHQAMTGDKCKEKDYQAPWTLLPPHAAPLDMIYYTHSKLPQLHNRLVMGWHGYRVTGNRLVAFPVNDDGLPELQQKAFYWQAPISAGGEYTRHAFTPKGGFAGSKRQVAQHEEIISQWHEIPGLRPEGAPVGLTQAADGSLFIVDDRNAAILRLSSGSAWRPKPTTKPVPPPVVVLPPEPIMDVLRAHCSQCHGELVNEPGSLLNHAVWLRYEDGKTLIEQRVFHDKQRPMPPGRTLKAEDLAALSAWLKSFDLLNKP